MVTYLYWAILIGLAAAVAAVGARSGRLKAALAASAALLVVGWGAYSFYLQQVFVKRWGGVMSISVPEGQYHIATTWKDDNLWVENYDPSTNSCLFIEYSKGNLLQGRVTIKNCNPLARPSSTGVRSKEGFPASPPSQTE